MYGKERWREVDCTTAPPIGSPPQLQLHSLTVLYSTLTHLCRHLNQVTAAVAISGSGHRIQCRYTARAVAWPRRKHGLGGG